jgi:hypothetical protein
MMFLKNIVLTIVLIFFNSCSVKSQKINGACFVSPNSPEEFSNFQSLKRINAQWVALTPYAFSKEGEPSVTFNHKHSWWGEQSEGTTLMIEQAKSEGLKIMLKPHVWVMGQGWCGQFDLKTEDEWKIWEKDYAKYILSNAKVAEKYSLDMLCIGTEYKIAATKRTLYWKGLIKAIRKIYSGKVIYASNWDNYDNIKFWGDLDFIGVDAYFPLTASKNVDTVELNKTWIKVVNDLEVFSKKRNKQIIFTEFGYKSTHFSAWNQWEVEGVRGHEKVNILAQENSYKILFQNVWAQEWFGGGFLWKWYADDSKSGGLENSDYTPQHKPVEKIINQYYK